MKMFAIAVEVVKKKWIKILVSQIVVEIRVFYAPGKTKMNRNEAYVWDLIGTRNVFPQFIIRIINHTLHKHPH